MEETRPIPDWPLIYMALVHGPVYNKAKKIVTSAVTNLDIHDISRLSRSYGCRGYFIVTPLELQQKLVGRLLDHWHSDRGANYNWTRQEAFKLVHLASDLNEVKQAIERETGQKPKVVATTARDWPGRLNFKQLGEMIWGRENPWLIILGTGWGLVDEFLQEQADVVLEPIKGVDYYNHFSVRCAAAIILDRLLGTYIK